MFNSGTFNGLGFNGAPLGAEYKSDSESTAAIGEDESVGITDSESLYLNVEGDAPAALGTFNSFTFNGCGFNSAQKTVGSDWSITATFTDAESTQAVTESESVIQMIDLDLSSSEPSFVDIYSLRWGHRLNQRSHASFRVLYPGASPTYYAPRVGHRFKLRDFSGTVRFHGSIQTTRKRLHNDHGTKYMWIECECTGWEQIADRFLVVETYTSQTLAAIAGNIVSTYLAADGVTATGLPTGPTLDKVIFSYQRASDCFDELSRLTGYWWRIDSDKNLTFYLPSTASASPLTIDANGLTYRTLEVEEDRSQYRNKQYLSNVKTLTASRSESFKGDGAQRTFSVGYDLNAAPTITKNAGAQTVGIRDIDTGKDWYWSKGSPEIVQDSGGTLLTSSDTLAITYVGEYLQVRAVTDSAEVTDRASIEGGSGIYEWLTDDGAGLTTAAAADAYAQSLIDRNAPLPSRVRIESDGAGNTLPGQYVAITEASLGLSGNFFVEEAEFEVIGGTQTIRAHITCSSNEPEQAWQNAWKVKRQQEDLTQAPTSGV